jgi:membrane-associated phospholipid phosphatase
MFVSFRKGLFILCTFLISSGLVQFLKRLVFTDNPRPVSLFRDLGLELHRVEGVKYLYHFSFPSGHSTTVFAMFIGLALMTKNKLLKLLLLISAYIIAYSRVYLSQHFLIDILTGSLIGTVSAFFIFYLTQNIKKAWIDKSILTINKGDYA